MKTALHQSWLPLDAVKKFVNTGFDVNAVDSNNETPLFYVRNEKVAKYLIDNGANPKHINIFGETLFFHAPVHMMALLIQYDININHIDKEGFNALKYATQLAEAKFLVEHGAIPPDIESYNKYRDFYNDDLKHKFDFIKSLCLTDRDFFNACYNYVHPEENAIEMKDIILL